ncbi:glycosyltransferase family 2 protein [Nonomuraea roseola]|uniref:Glycosyltransferase family 2 protein n=1 Tax=Nonomuraea roseola TaxID=46179 RepID=A0ABV5Q0N4_9ACTN
MKVSVIVNVHNPGNTADACIRSVLEQTLPPDDYEVIFVDDGSTDGIAERLDTVASARPNVRVLHLPHTGSVMRGRNVGVASATGDYVYLLDQRDRLERGALKLMYERAVECDSDVLIGRLVRDGGRPIAAFEVNRARADVLRDKLLTLLTPHKLCRKAFLEEHMIGFAVPGGKVAEQTFSVRAYLAAKVVTVLADEVCCHMGEPEERPDDDPLVVAAELRALLDVIDAGTEAGRQRDKMYAHWFRSTVLRLFRSTRFARSSVDRGLFFTTFRTLTQERFPERLDRYLPVHLRAMAVLLRAGRLDQLISFGADSRRSVLRTDLSEVSWVGGVLELGLAVEIYTHAGEPARFREDGDRLHWRPPGSVDHTLLPDEVTDVTDAVARARIDVYLRHQDTGDVYFVPVTSEAVRIHERGRVRVQVHGRARVDVATGAVGEPLPSGQWEIHVRMYGGAHRASSRISRSDGPLTCLGVLAERPRRRLVVPCWSDSGELGLCIEPRSFSESIALVSSAATVTKREGHVFVVVPVPYVPPSGGPAMELVLRDTSRKAREVSVPALVEPGLPGKAAGQLVAKVPVKRFMPGPEHVGPGAWLTSLREEDRETGLRFALEMRRGRVEVRPATAVDPEYNPLGRDTALRRLARRVPGARYAVRLVRAGTHRYLRD